MIRFRTLALSCALSALLGGVALAEKVKGKVVMRDGRVFEDVLYEIRENGRKLWVKRKYGEVTYDMALVKDMVAAKPDVTEGGEEPGGELGQDWRARFRLEAPEGWKLVKPDLPLVRAQMRHSERDAVFTVRVRPAQKPWTFDKDEARALGGEFEDELERMYRRFAGARTVESTLYGAPVYRLDKGSVEHYGAPERARRSFWELRFQRFGFEYALSISVADQDAGALESELEPVFRSFSFLPALEADDQSYSDLARGFALSVPVEGWTMKTWPFDDARPVVLRNDDGRVLLEVEVAAGRDPEELVRSRINERRRRSTRIRNVEVKADRLNGAEVVRFGFQDFREGDTKLRYFSGFAARASGHMLVFTGDFPLSDTDSDRLRRELNAILDTVRVADPRRLAAEARAAKSAWELLAQGHSALAKDRFGEARQRFSEAIDALPGFALAFYLRAQAKKGENDFRGYKEDLEEAGRIAPGAGYTKDLSGLDLEQARASAKARDYGKALELFARVYRDDSSAEVRKEMLDAASRHWSELKRKKRFDAWEEIEDQLKAYDDDREVALSLLKLYYDAVRTFTRSNKFSDGRKVLRSAKKVVRGMRRDKDYKKLQKEYDSADQALDRREEQSRRRR